jgi:hypothetical protein
MRTELHVAEGSDAANHQQREQGGAQAASGLRAEKVSGTISIGARHRDRHIVRGKLKTSFNCAGKIPVDIDEFPLL